MAEKENKNMLRAFMLVQQLQPEYWAHAAHEPTPPVCPRNSGYDSDEAAWGRYDAAKEAHDGITAALAAARAGDVAPLVGWIAARLKPCGVQEVHGILHDKDALTVWDGAKMEYVQTPKVNHVHILCRFRPQKKFSTDRTLASVAAALGVEQQYIGNL